jgi:hypothetical protein
MLLPQKVRSDADGKDSKYLPRFVGTEIPIITLKLKRSQEELNAEMLGFALILHALYIYVCL